MLLLASDGQDPASFVFGIFDLAGLSFGEASTLLGN